MEVRCRVSPRSASRTGRSAPVGRRRADVVLENREPLGIGGREVVSVDDENASRPSIGPRARCAQPGRIGTPVEGFGMLGVGTTAGIEALAARRQRCLSSAGDTPLRIRPRTHL